MRGGTTVKHNRNANKRTHRVRRRQNRPAYYMVKKPNIVKYKKYFNTVLPKRLPKAPVTVRKSTRIRRERIPFDPSVNNTGKTMKNRGIKLNGSAAATAAANTKMSAAAIPSAAKERLAVVNRARELYGVSGATKNVRAAFIRLYMKAKKLGATLSQALFAAENEIAASMAAAAPASAAPASAAPASAAPASAAPASAAPASAAPATAAPAAVPAFANNNNADNIEAMLAELHI